MEEKHYSKLMLERIVAGELDMPKDAEQDELFRRRIEEIRESNRAILEQYPAEEVAHELGQRLALAEDETVSIDEASERGETDGEPVSLFRRRSFRGFALVAAAAIIALAAIVPQLIGRTGIGSDEPVRIKGLKPSISVYRQIDGSVELLRDSSKVSEGDLLQISYISASEPYGVILSLDGRGVVTVHLPDTRYSGSSARLEPNGEVALDFSYRLDDAPSFERFFFLTSDRVFDVTLAANAAKKLASKDGVTGDLDLPDYISQYSVALVKESSR
jgi:hypothetical protein